MSAEVKDAAISLLHSLNSPFTPGAQGGPGRLVATNVDVHNWMNQLRADKGITPLRSLVQAVCTNE